MSNLIWKVSEGERNKDEGFKFKSRGKSGWEGPETWKYLRRIVLCGLKEKKVLRWHGYLILLGFANIVQINYYSIIL